MARFTTFLNCFASEAIVQTRITSSWVSLDSAIDLHFHTHIHQAITWIEGTIQLKPFHF